MNKIIYLYLMGSLNICSVLFAMQLDEQKAQQMLQDVKKDIGEHKYEEAHAILRQFVNLRIKVSPPLALEIKNAENLLLQKELKYAQQLVSEGNYRKAYNMLMNFRLQDFDRDAVDKLQQSLLQVLKNAEQLIAQDKLKEAHDILRQFGYLDRQASGTLSLQIINVGNLLIQKELKDAQQLVSKGKYEEAYDMFDKFKFLALFRGFDKDVADKLEQSLLQAIKNAEQLVAEEKLEEAYNILSKFQELNIRKNDSMLFTEIKKLEQLLQKAEAQTNLKAAEDYAKQDTEEGYKKAYRVLNRLKQQTIKASDAAKLEIKIKQQEAAWRKAQNPIVPLEQPKWIFIKQMPDSTQERTDPKSDWNVTKKKELILNLGATDAITAYTFVDLIKQAQDNQLPFILVMIQSGDPEKFFPHFFSVDVLISLMQTWRATNKLVNPMNREDVFNIEIYVMGDDGILRLLKDKVVDAVYLENFVDYKGYTDDPTTGRRTHNYKVKPELEEPGKPGVAQILIADLYKKQETTVKPELQQLERLWLSWALPKFSAADSAQKEQAIQRLNAIPNKPELVSKQVEIVVEQPPVVPVQPTTPITPVPPITPKIPLISTELLSALHNFSIKLGQFAQKLR